MGVSAASSYERRAELRQAVDGYRADCTVAAGVHIRMCCTGVWVAAGSCVLYALYHHSQ